jgi:cytochrome c
LYTFELNKIVGAILASILFIKVLGIAGENLFEPKEQEKVAFPVTVEEASGPASATQPEEQGPPFEALLAEASPDDGAKVFRKCQACHTADKDGKNLTGPLLYDVIGRQVASEAGFNYTTAMKDHGGDWTYERLDTYLTNPQKVVPGTKMSFAGLPKPKDRAAVIAYLREHTDNPPPLPPVPEQQAQPAPAAESSASGATGEEAAPAEAEKPAESATDGAEKTSE